MVMLVIAVSLLLANTLAIKFESPNNSTINDFSYTNSNLYVTTPLKTYLLNDSLEITDEFSKQFNNSLLLYIDSNILLECGDVVNTTDCCFLRHASNLSSIQSNSSTSLCQKFRHNVHYYPCNAGVDGVFVLVSFYKYPTSGAFSRMHFGGIRNGELYENEARLGYLINFRSIVVSPAMGRYQKYVVIKQSATLLNALYIDPDLNNLLKNAYAELHCDADNKNVSFGFGLAADAAVALPGLDLSNHMTHFIMYQNKTFYRICAFSEEAEMKPQSANTEKLSSVYKDALITLDSSNRAIQALNGITVNGGLAIYFSVKQHLFKIVMTNADSHIRDTSQTPIYTASQDITKIEFSSANMGLVSTKTTIESFATHQCGFYTDCGACTGKQDPHCGWCSLESKCSTRDDCKLVPDLWTQDTSQCLEISISDDNKDVLAEQQLILNAANIELLSDAQYTCVFTSKEGEVNTTAAAYSDYLITCTVPTLAQIEAGLLVLDVSVMYLTSTIGDVKINYHQCDLYNECADCSSISKFCTWCPLEATCTRQELARCQKYRVQDPSKCPVITGTQPEKVPRNTIKAKIVVSVNNLPEYVVSTVYQCKVTSRMNVSHSETYDIGSESTNNTIFCTDVQINEQFPEYYESESLLDISIVYGSSVGSVAVVNGELSVYACELLASDCVMCVGMYSNDYSCRFCTDTCAYHDAQVCESGTVIADNPNTCLEENTAIEKVLPDWSPGEGGVPITLTGKSLAVVGQRITIKLLFKKESESDTLIDCINSTILNSTCLQCVSPDIMPTFGMMSMVRELPSVLVINYDGGDIEKHTSSTQFMFTPLDIALVKPDYGPESGGTRIRVNGTRLCVPGKTSVAVNGIDCTDISCNITSQALECLTPPGSGRAQNVSVYLGAAAATAANFNYRSDPVVTEVSPNCTLEQGGINMTVVGSNLTVVQEPLLLILPHLNSSCTDPGLQSVAPTLHTPTLIVYRLPPVNVPSSYRYGFKMDGVANMCDTPRVMEVVDPPDVISSDFDARDGTKTLVCDIEKPCYFTVQMTEIHRFVDQVAVTIGSLPCTTLEINTTRTNDELVMGTMRCLAPSLDEIKGSVTVSARAKRAPGDAKERDLFIVTIGIGAYSQTLGRLEFVEKGFDMVYLYIGGGVLGGFVMLFVILVVKNRRDKMHMSSMEKKHQHDLDHVEASYAKAARQEFTELTLMPADHNSSVMVDPCDIPYRIFSDYLVHIMFPNVDKRKIMNNLQLEQCEIPEYTLTEFRKFLNDDVFLLTFIDVIERQRDFQVAHRCEVASYLTIALYHDFNYLSHILFQLLNKLIANDVQKSPKLLLRATKSVAEKLLTNWLSLSLYDYLSTMTGLSLYELCYKITQTVELGPLDFVTHHARYALSQDKILSEEVVYNELKVEAEGPDGARSKGLVSVLDCDTISQVKGKIYRSIYTHQPYSQQPPLESLSLLWTPSGSTGGVGSMELSDFDERMSDNSGDKKFNTLLSYKVQNNDLLKLTMFNDFHQAPMGTIRSVKRQTVSEVCRSHLVKNNQDFQDFRSPAPSKRSTTVTTTKIASEAFLPSLIRTKDHLGRCLDGLMNTIFMESNNIPPAIKYMFDYLDLKTDLLSERDRQDTEIAHIWKTNSLPLRFWINIIKNPQFLFDIEKPPIMDSYLSVIGQCFMDSFSLATMTLNKDSSANKLVYNREVTVYRNKVDKWYRDVRQSPSVTLRTVVSESKLPPLPFRSKFAVSQLFKYAQKYQAEISAALPVQGQPHTRSDFEVLTKPLS